MSTQQEEEEWPGTLANGAHSGPSPCPVLNMLHKEGHLSAEGITHSAASTALLNVGLAPSLAKLLSTNALHKAGSKEHTFDLVALRKHNIIEHDASLTRLDEWQGNNWVFHHETWTRSMQLLDNQKEEISLSDLSEMRLGAIDAAREDAKTTHAGAGAAPFKFGLAQEWVSLIQWAMLFHCLSDGRGSVKVAHLDWFMTHEQFPPGFTFPSNRLGAFGLFTGPFLKLAALSVKHSVESRICTVLAWLHLRPKKSSSSSSSGAASNNTGAKKQ